MEGSTVMTHTTGPKPEDVAFMKAGIQALVEMRPDIKTSAWQHVFQEYQTRFLHQALDERDECKARALAAGAYDPTADTITIYGVKYAMELFKHLGIGPVGRWLRVIKREDGVITLEQKEEPDEQSKD
jgi:hypothetical protein